MRFLTVVLLLLIAAPLFAHEAQPSADCPGCQPQPQAQQQMLVPRVSYQPQVTYESVPMPQMQPQLQMVPVQPTYRRVLFPRLWGVRPNVWVQTPRAVVCVGGACW